MYVKADTKLDVELIPIIYKCLPERNNACWLPN